MIKLTDLLNEIEKPENIYTPGFSPEEEDKEFLKKGYRMVGTTIDPETGKSSSNVEHLAQFSKISNDLSNIMKQISPLKRLIPNKKDVLLTDIKDKATYIVSTLRQVQTAINDISGHIDMINQRSNKPKI
jgi:hypothetical protein